MTNLQSSLIQRLKQWLVLPPTFWLHVSVNKSSLSLQSSSENNEQLSNNVCTHSVYSSGDSSVVIRQPEPIKKYFRTWVLASEGVTPKSYNAPPLFKPQCFQSKISTMTHLLGSLVSENGLFPPQLGNLINVLHSNCSPLKVHMLSGEPWWSPSVDPSSDFLSRANCTNILNPS